MPRIIRQLPPNRADYSFADLVHWHLFEYGTRPKGDPAARTGKLWTPKQIGHSGIIRERSVRNWLGGELPKDTVALELLLFGDSDKFDDWRRELRDSLRKARLQNAQQSEPGPPSGNDQKSPENNLPGEPEAIGPADETPPAAPESNSGNEGSNSGAAAGSVPASLPISYRPQLSQNRGKIISLFVTGLAVILGMWAWSLRPFDKLASQSPSPGPAPGPALPPKPAPEQPKDPPKTEEQQRAELEKRNLEKIIEALKAAHDKEKRDREEEARRLDREGPSGAAARAQREREWNAREVAGAGYRLLEYTGITGGNTLGPVQTDTVFDCAISCLRDRCDAFAWFRDERPSGPRTCYRYKGPVTFYDNPGYTAGKKVNDILSGAKFGAANRPGLPRPLRRFAQASSSTQSDASPDDVTHCPNGPVKVTGFNVSCDEMLVGGTTLGSTRLSWTVANINECASKCRPVSNCVGFTFNAAQQGGHSCVLFGPTPEKREAPGWISGERSQ